MSYSSQASDINTPDVSMGFIGFLTNGEFDEMLSNTPRRLYYDNLLSPDETVGKTRNEANHKSEECVDQHRTIDKPNEVVLWGCEETDDVCLEALDKYIWGEGYTDDERLLLETCTKIESST